MISIIIPVLNEEKIIKNQLQQLTALEGDFELIVVDGGSRDKTPLISKSFARVVNSKKGRAIQMNAGAGIARGDVLFFLHADCSIEKNALPEIKRIMEQKKVVGGALSYDVEEDGFLFRNLVYWSRLRAKLTSVYPGDHGLFVRREVFDEVGGFPHIQLMEDIALCKELKKKGRVIHVNSKIFASTRRFEEKGFFRTVLQMWLNRFLFFIRISPDRFIGCYRDAR